MKIRTEDLGTKNLKRHSSEKAGNLQMTLSFLLGYNGDVIPEEVAKFKVEGVQYMILRTLSNSMDHKCNHYDTVVVNSRNLSNHIKCVGCSIGACRSCYKCNSKYIRLLASGTIPLLATKMLLANSPGCTQQSDFYLWNVSVLTPPHSKMYNMNMR